MSEVATLESIQHSLWEIEHSKERHNYAGGAAALEHGLREELKVWPDRTMFFERISSELDNVVEIAQNTAIRERAKELYATAIKTEDMLNVVLHNFGVPPEETNTALRGVLEDEQLLSSPLIRGELVKLAIYGGDFDLRRLVWLRLCRHHAQSPPPANPGGEGEFGAHELRRLRKSFIRERQTLGPRGTVTDPAEAPGGAKDIVPKLLAALANPVDVERKEAALTLGEIGGGEVAIFLADALRSEVEEGSAAEDYQMYLASALSNLGGPDAIEGLLRAAEKGSERVCLAALSGLESLATAGAVALTEYPEPVAIEGEEMKEAYLRLAKRLSDLNAAATTPDYVRLRARELLDTIQLSLNSTHFSSLYSSK